MRILVVEDENKIRQVLKSFLESKGEVVYEADNGQSALEAFYKEQPDVVLLDLMLPVLSGEEVCRTIRERATVPVPILMLTAKSEEESLLGGLDLGADDYLIKPFSMREMYARMQAVYRRYQNILGEEEIRILDSGVILEEKARTAWVRGQACHLTPIEYRLLEMLMKQPKRVFSREELIAEVLGEEYEGFDRVIDSHVKNLRQKLEEDPKNPVIIQTIHGIGYRYGGDG